MVPHDPRLLFLLASITPLPVVWFALGSAHFLLFWHQLNLYVVVISPQPQMFSYLDCLPEGLTFSPSAPSGPVSLMFFYSLFEVNSLISLSFEICTSVDVSARMGK